MQDELQLHHLSRYEKKKLVKGWHVKQESTSDLLDTADQRQQLTHSSSFRSQFAPPPGALAYETQRTATWRSTVETTGDQELTVEIDPHEKLPKTVGQVKHAYRARARKEEARDVAQTTRRRNMRQELRNGPKRRDRDHTNSRKVREEIPSPPEQDVDQVETCDESQDTADYGADGLVRLIDLQADEIATDAAYRDEILKQIRRQLADGGGVVLESNVLNTPEKVSSTRFMMQVLCSESLAHCVRDQDVVPDVSSQQNSTRLVLRLLPRHRPTDP